MAKFEIDTDTGIIRRKDNPFLWTLLFIFILICAIMNDINKKAPKEEADNVKKYCSAQQLPKTGHKACNDAKAILRNRYEKEIKNATKYLQEKQNAITSLISQKEQKCSTENVKQYGQSACDEALKNIKDNEKYIEKANNEINEYERKIQDLNSLKIDGTHIVSTDVLNFRSCPKAECSIIGKLVYGDVVNMQEDLGEWLKISAKNKTGYVSKNFLWDNRNNPD